MTLYVGSRRHKECAVLLVEPEAGSVFDLPDSLRSLDFPNGQWEWGYGGQGPAELAFALCNAETGNLEQARQLHQHFKWRVVSKLPKHGWVLSSDEIQQHLDAIRKEHKIDQPAADGVIDLGQGAPRALPVEDEDEDEDEDEV